MPPESVISDLNARHALPNLAQIVPGNGNLPKIQITTPAASAEIYLHGAQLTSWHPADQQEVIFLSERSRFEDGKAIRGGIPICFPWFRAKADNPKAPAHGTVRTKAWQLESIAQQGDSIVVTLFTESDDESHRWWPHDFHIVHRITVGAQLKLELIVTNTGPTLFQFEEALHTYHRVGNVQQIQIEGLDTVAFLDNRDDNRKKIQLGALTLTQATDNAYLHTESTVEILDPNLHRRVRIAKQNSETTIVWNPWQESENSLADLGISEWQTFACVEASNILLASVPLSPGEHHTMTVRMNIFPI